VHPWAGLFWFAAAAGITQGLSFSWYLYGVEKIAFAVALELGNRLSVAAGTMALVHGSGDAWIFFALQTTANVLVMATGLAYILQRNRVRRPSLRAVGRLLGDGVHAVVSRCGFGIFTGVNTFLLGLHASSSVVGQYAGAERITRVVSVSATPISQALFPRISHLKVSGPARVAGLRRLGGAATLIAGGFMSLLTFLLAPLVTRLMLGPGFEASSTILRILSPLPLLVSANHVLVYQFLFPEGEYRFVSLSVVGATALVLTALHVFGWAGNPNAMAAAADVAEVAALGCLIFRVRQQSGWPFATSPA
jgi:PST family polysaccharide transporter